MYWSSNYCFNLAFKCGFILFTFVINDGSCKERESPHENSSPVAIKQPLEHHSHLTRNVWTSRDKTTLPWDESRRQMPNIVPLTLEEQILREKKSSSRKEKEDKNKKSTKRSEGASNKHKSEESKREKGKSGDYDSSDDILPPESELPMLREKALNFGKLVLEYLKKEILAPASDNENGEARARNVFSDITSKFHAAQKRQEGGGEGASEGGRGVIDWVARLIGVQGKTLGEFLREYQVHVLYDLVFTFFKWIFFLYAGLLIP